MKFCRFDFALSNVYKVNVRSLAYSTLKEPLHNLELIRLQLLRLLAFTSFVQGIMVKYFSNLSQTSYSQTVH